MEYRFRTGTGVTGGSKTIAAVSRCDRPTGTESWASWIDITRRKRLQDEVALRERQLQLVLSRRQRLDLPCWTRTCGISRSMTRWPR